MVLGVQLHVSAILPKVKGRWHSPDMSLADPDIVDNTPAH
jgi:hypothetical protein